MLILHERSGPRSVSDFSPQDEREKQWVCKQNYKGSAKEVVCQRQGVCKGSGVPATGGLKGKQRANDMGSAREVLCQRQGVWN